MMGTIALKGRETMGHLKMLLNKMMFGGIVVWIILALLGGVNWLAALLISVGLVVMSYVIGDLLLLPQAGNLVSTIADGGLAYLYFWSLNLFGIQVNAIAVLLSVVSVLVVEGLIFHPYLKRIVSLDAQGPRIGDRS